MLSHEWIWSGLIGVTILLALFLAFLLIKNSKPIDLVLILWLVAMLFSCIGIGFPGEFEILCAATLGALGVLVFKRFAN